ncbi:hypothetical protein WJ85_32350 [Burkholderia ubonensis]|nr:hypothetical protein WJ85_32350 [Burkholderia ubonensis]KWC00278.1 hypothetical protein WL44_30010 [Burkholderia ubonensis]
MVVGVHGNTNICGAVGNLLDFVQRTVKQRPATLSPDDLLDGLRHDFRQALAHAKLCTAPQVTCLGETLHPFRLRAFTSFPIALLRGFVSLLSCCGKQHRRMFLGRRQYLGRFDSSAIKHGRTRFLDLHARCVQFKKHAEHIAPDHIGV